MSCKSSFPKGTVSRRSRLRNLFCRLKSTAGALCLYTLCGVAVHANVLQNPGFEAPALSGGDAFGGLGWNVFGNGYTTLLSPHNGSQAFKAFGEAAGAYQDFSASPGETWLGSVWALNAAYDSLTGGQIAAVNIEWRDSIGALIAYDTTQLLTSANPVGLEGSDYIFGQVTGDAPAGTAYARFVLITGGFDGPGGGAVRFDDAALTRVPEPSTSNMVALVIGCVLALTTKPKVAALTGVLRARGSGAALALFFTLCAPVLVASTDVGWQLVWSDEFNGPVGAPPNPTKWNYNIGDGGWGNGEIQRYTADPANAFQDGGGNLVIRAIRDAFGQFTSARLSTGSPAAQTHTADANWQYGRIQARIKTPLGQGVWPAFWMLGQDLVSNGWPQSGEIDILETLGTFDSNEYKTNASAHGPGYTGSVGRAYRLPLGRRLSDDFHLYTVDWSPGSIEWAVDGVAYYRFTPESLPPGAPWVFDHPFFVLLNVAIAGPTTVAVSLDGKDYLMGTPDPAAPFAPKDMLVDYVRVYQRSNLAAGAPVITPGCVFNAASYLGDIAPGSLVSLCGDNLSGGTYSLSPENGAFPVSAGGTVVRVNGISAALTYVSPNQIKFQLPWELTPGVGATLTVIHEDVASNEESLTIASAAPAAFLADLENGVAWITAESCGRTQSTMRSGGAHSLWANGLGPKNAPLQNGIPAALAGAFWPLEVLGGSANCSLAIGGRAARVSYCGAAPGLIIDQVNFEYPEGVPVGQPFVDAVLTVASISGRFRLPVLVCRHAGAER